jgi:hypothetical protein
MRRYGRDLGDIDNPLNLLPLRPDIHKCFDKRFFVFVPKAAGRGSASTLEMETSSRSPQYVSHILSASAAEYWPTYHNTIIQYLEDGARPYLFARFAWAILLFVKPFITSGFSRHVVSLHVSTNSEGLDEIVRKPELLSGAILLSRYGGGGSKSATPKKRKSEGGAPGEEDSFPWSSEDSDDSVEDNIWDDAMDWEAKGRRRRQQISSDETAPEMMSEEAGALAKVSNLEIRSLESACRGLDLPRF